VPRPAAIVVRPVVTAVLGMRPVVTVVTVVTGVLGIRLLLRLLSIIAATGVSYIP
jgi:hypothetical protein